MKTHWLLISLLMGASLHSAWSQAPRLNRASTEQAAVTRLPATHRRQGYVPDRGFWVVETLPGPKPLVIVHYYDANQLECQTDILARPRLALHRRRVTARLTTRLATVLNQSDLLVQARP